MAVLTITFSLPFPSLPIFPVFFSIFIFLLFLFSRVPFIRVQICDIVILIYYTHGMVRGLWNVPKSKATMSVLVCLTLFIVSSGKKNLRESHKFNIIFYHWNGMSLKKGKSAKYAFFSWNSQIVILIFLPNTNFYGMWRFFFISFNSFSCTFDRENLRLDIFHCMLLLNRIPFEFIY